jgi:hypothetical protein
MVGSITVVGCVFEGHSAVSDWMNYFFCFLRQEPVFRPLHADYSPAGRSLSTTQSVAEPSPNGFSFFKAEKFCLRIKFEFALIRSTYEKVPGQKEKAADCTK